MTTPKDSAKRGKRAPKTVVGVCSEVNACILVSKRGTLKEVCATESDYGKVCKTPPTYASAFKCQATWTIKKYEAVIELWARANGRAGQENAYEFPPPVDETLFFGDCILVSRKYESGSAAGSVSCAPLTVASWKKMYAHLFGGFDDLVKLADADENEIDELEHISDKKKTRDGYLKDGFIVDDGAAARINIKSELHKMKLVAKTRDYADAADSESEYREDTSDGDVDGDDDDDDDDDENSPDAVAIKSGTANDDSDDESTDDASDDEAVAIDNDAIDDDDDDADDDGDDADDGDGDDDDDEASANENSGGRNQKVRPEIKSKLQLQPSSSQESVSAGNNSKCNKGNNANNNSNNTYNIITKIKIVRGVKNAATTVQSDPNIKPTSNPTTNSTPTPKSDINAKIKQKQPLKLKRTQNTKASAAARAAIVAAGTALAASASAKPISLSDTIANASSDASELSEEPYEY